MANRWWIYQRERFPLVAHGLLIAVFCASAVTYVAQLCNSSGATLGQFGAAFGTAFCFFFQIRVADEFKDHAEDCAHRPYRPVPRGLVTLRELRWAAIAAAVLQLMLALVLDVRLVVGLVILWVYLGLMTTEFFVPRWLKRHPVAYMVSHITIVPLILVYSAACHLIVTGARPGAEVAWFLLAAGANGFVFEIGRKIRAPEDEEPGVETYSVLWGPVRATQAWFAAVACAGAAAWLAARLIGFGGVTAIVQSVLLALLAIAGWRYVQKNERRRAKLIEPLSALWTLTVYLNLGPIPEWIGG
ncbi:MAG: UbiA family prenyltransferase [Planctomycetota bacterium]|jgi:4-hydroxybenzoate polyprenyltransferase